ncbi:MAG: Rid family hydrolase [Pseudomonadota bacterium]
MDTSDRFNASRQPLPYRGNHARAVRVGNVIHIAASSNAIQVTSPGSQDVENPLRAAFRDVENLLLQEACTPQNLVEVTVYSNSTDHIEEFTAYMREIFGEKAPRYTSILIDSPGEQVIADMSATATVDPAGTM